MPKAITPVPRDSLVALLMVGVTNGRSDQGQERIKCPLQYAESKEHLLEEVAGVVVCRGFLAFMLSGQLLLIPPFLRIIVWNIVSVTIGDARDVITNRAPLTKQPPVYRRGKERTVFINLGYSVQAREHRRLDNSPCP